VSVAESAVFPAEPVLEPAGFWIRAGARLADIAVQTVVGFVVGIIMAIIAGMMEAMGGRPAADFIASMERTTFIGWIGSVLTVIAYHSCFEGLAGTTIGKRIFGLQVIDMATGPVTFTQGVKRSLGFLVDGLFFGAIGAHSMNESPEKQRVGDHWAKTRVVRRRSLPHHLRTPSWRVLAGFLLATLVLALLDTATLLGEYLLFIGRA
jgi:uncharacterized RDD family membrane protein YckC